MSFEEMSSKTKSTENKPAGYSQGEFRKEAKKIDSQDLRQMNPNNQHGEKTEKIKIDLKIDTLSGKKQDLENIKKLGEQAGIDVSDTLASVEAEIKTIKQGLPAEEEQEKEASETATTKQAESGFDEASRADKNRETAENNEKEKSPAEITLEKMKKFELVDHAKQLAGILRERENERFSPIVHPDAAQHLSATAGSLEDMLQNRKATMEDITTVIRRIGGVMNAFGKELPRQSVIRDDPESLKRVAYAIRNVGESCNNIKSELGGEEDKNLEEMANYFNRLINVSEEAFSYVGRKHQILSNR